MFIPRPRCDQWVFKLKENDRIESQTKRNALLEQRDRLIGANRL